MLLYVIKKQFLLVLGGLEPGNPPPRKYATELHDFLIKNIPKQSSELRFKIGKNVTER